METQGDTDMFRLSILFLKLPDLSGLTLRSPTYGKSLLQHQITQLCTSLPLLCKPLTLRRLVLPFLDATYVWSTQLNSPDSTHLRCG